MKPAGALALAAVGAAVLAAWWFLDDEAAEPDAVVDVVVKRYAFVPGTDEPLRVPANATVVLRIRSEDVTHGLAIEGLHSGVEIPPGETVELTLRTGAPGEFRIYCTVFCGAGHPEHKGTLVVVAG